MEEQGDGDANRMEGDDALRLSVGPWSRVPRDSLAFGRPVSPPVAVWSSSTARGVNLEWIEYAGWGWGTRGAAFSSAPSETRLRSDSLELTFSLGASLQIAHTLASVRKAKPANFLAVQQEEDEEDSPPRRPPSVTSTDPSARRSGVVGESSSSHRPKEHTSRRRSGKERGARRLQGNQLE